MSAPTKKLPLPAEVHIFDDGQPINNPKPYWLVIAKLNEPIDAWAFAEDYKRRYSYARLRVMVDGKEWVPRGQNVSN